MSDDTTPIDDLPSATSRSLVDQVHAELRARILDGRLPAGAPLPDSAVARQMGVSRAPVREAMALLAQTGLLTKRAHHPFRVRETSTNLAELQLVRWGHESAAARHLVLSGLPVDDMEEPLGVMQSLRARTDPIASARADLAFHRSMVRATGLPILIGQYEEIACQVESAMQSYPLSVLPSNALRHQELLGVLRAAQSSHDPSVILRLLETHLLTVRSDVSVEDEAFTDGSTLSET